MISQDKLNKDLSKESKRVGRLSISLKTGMTRLISGVMNLVYFTTYSFFEPIPNFKYISGCFYRIEGPAKNIFQPYRISPFRNKRPPLQRSEFPRRLP